MTNVPNRKSLLVSLMQVVIVCLQIAGVSSCSTNSEPPTELEVQFVQPSNFPTPVYNFKDNPVTTGGFVLGRTLFYDGILSKDGSISCGSCHMQSAAFTHHGHDVSHGIRDQLGNRNSPAIMNVAWQPVFFWDGGVHDLDLFSVAPIENPIEMDEKLDNVLNKLRASEKYRELFKKAYGSEEISTARFLKALSQFMVMCVSSNSRYDEYSRNKSTTVLSQRELQGLSIFKQKCSACHSGELFTDFSFRDNGIAQGKKIDSGLARITLRNKDFGKFKVPSLRNVALTAPYMHDGRLRTLEAVLNHYRTGVQQHDNLDSLLRTANTLGISLTDEEATLIIEFLQTLSDSKFITNKLLSEQ